MSSTRALFKSIALTAVAAGLLTAPMAFAQTTPASAIVQPLPTTLSLTVTGEVSIAPDMATVNFGVVSQGKTAAEAMKAGNVRMNAVMSALKAAGIAAKDIQTSNLQLNPQYNYGSNQAPKLTGYEARNQVTVRVNDLDKTGPVIDAVIGAGVNQIDQIGFGLKDDAAALDQARQKAVTILNQRAALYASATGLKLKKLLSIEEGAAPSYHPPRPYALRAEAAMKDASTPVSAGELQQSVTITGTFELEK
ncbi:MULTISPECIES: SIMPL domain-containing protein [Asticcacaulis]|uniref:SIMPL domain-containing protein n=1 Tax=Asticcacaulis TaxID=76890 RepID=UPI001AE60D28|nr:MULTISPECIES: SIMPL domain-containing protein [Asticcacaulis]MBP2158550.1 uncharacterized protein YggE [Asticcacaulis solisilvae]MDR6799596.1 uncharacterized protein YggE [Asticcacaulis sp. BE141]